MLSGRLRQLVGVRPALPFEAPGSWVTRVALDQGASAKDLVGHLRLPVAGDIDMAFAILYEGGLPRDASTIAALDVARTLMNGARRSGCAMERLLMIGRNRARYRYCALCLKGDSTPYIRQHWRFTCWRYCPEHACLLEDVCPHCRAHIDLPTSLITAGPDRRGIADLGRCTRCGDPLARVEPKELPDGPRANPWQMAFLRNGRAAVAAMFHGYIRMEGEANRKPLHQLRVVEMLGLLPTRSNADGSPMEF